MDRTMKTKVWNVLEDECGATSNTEEFFRFEQAWPECQEYRFMGSLGFGGKIWSNGSRIYVNCYREDETPERLAVIERTNARLEALVTPDSASEEPS